MSQKQHLSLTSHSVEETLQFAERIGSLLRGGECIELVSDLGGGKTTLTRGLVSGARSGDAVASPTFTISKVYKAPHFDIHHFDFYRLPDAGLAAHELHDLVGDKDIVLVIEWAGVVEEVLPSDRLTITLTRLSETKRMLRLEFPEHMKYLVENI